LVAVWEGRGGMGKKKGKQRKRVLSAEWIYNGFYRWTHRRNVSVCDSIGYSDGESAMSLYRYLGLNQSVKSSEKIHQSVRSLYGYLRLNPLVIPSIKSSYKNPHHSTVATFQTNYIGHRRYDWYIPTEYFRRYRPTLSPTE
jgi:hypothetical protein